MATNLTYNGITLKNVLTREFMQTSVQDPSNTDIWYWKYSILVSTILYRRVSSDTMILGVQIPSSSDSPLPSLMATLREKLMEKRKSFSMKIDNVTLLAAQGAGVTSVAEQDLDFNNGPNPISLKITQISSAAFRIEYEIEVCKGCADPVAAKNRIQSNRWNVADDIDEHGRVTRMWEGRLRVGYAADPSQMVHRLRDLCLPPLAEGFRRKKMKFLGEPNGLELVYTITDVQIATQAPPAPATMIFGSHSETVSVDSSNCIGEANITVEGLPGAPKSRLIEIGCSFIEQKLQIAKGKGKQHMLLSMTVIDEISPDYNRISVRARVRHVLGKALKRIAGVNMATMGQPITWVNLTNLDKSPINPNASAGLKLANALYCALQSPCDKDNTNRSLPGITGYGDEGGTSGGTPGTGSDGRASKPRYDDKSPAPTVKYAEATNLSSQAKENDPLNQTTDHLNFPWFEFEMNTIIDVHSGYIALPISGGNGTDSHAFIQLHKPTNLRTVRISAERVGQWPTIPSGSDITINGVFNKFLKARVIFKDRVRGANTEDYVFRIDAEHDYAPIRAYRASESIIVGGHPVDGNDTNYKTIFDNGSFNDKLITGQK